MDDEEEVEEWLFMVWLFSMDGSLDEDSLQDTLGLDGSSHE